MATPISARQRPKSPHLFRGPMRLHYRWSPAMLVSILHRATGDGMAIVGIALLTWFLAALAGGEASYRAFRGVFTTDGGSLNVLGIVVGVGLTFSLFQHMMSGIRHLVMDTGAAFELKTNRNLALLTMLFSVALTAIFWFVLGAR